MEDNTETQYQSTSSTYVYKLFGLIPIFSITIDSSHEQGFGEFGGNLDLD